MAFFVTRKRDQESVRGDAREKNEDAKSNVLFVAAGTCYKATRPHIRGAGVIEEHTRKEKHGAMDETPTPRVGCHGG